MFTMAPSFVVGLDGVCAASLSTEPLGSAGNTRRRISSATAGRGVSRCPGSKLPGRSRRRRRAMVAAPAQSRLRRAIGETRACFGRYAAVMAPSTATRAPSTRGRGRGARPTVRPELRERPPLGGCALVAHGVHSGMPPDRRRTPRRGVRLSGERSEGPDEAMPHPPTRAAAETPLDHSGLAARRVVAALILAVITAAIAVGAGATWSVAALGAEDAAAAVFLIAVSASIAGADAAATARLARAEDASRAGAEAVLLGAGVASLLAVFFTLAQAGHAGAPGRGLMTALAIASVALAWLSVHTVFLLRYARIYFTPPDGGIDFGDEPPDYGDFAYLALTIGMTFQVSDTDLPAKRVRRVALHHALLSSLFGTVIVAITVSSVAGLLGR